MRTQFFLAIFFPLFTFAQSGITVEQRQQANQFFQEGSWQKSIAAYQAIAQAEPQNWNAQMRWGISLTNSGKPKDALPLLENADKIGNNGQTKYYLGSAYAKDGNREKAFEWLDKALTNGFGALSIFESDAGYNSFKSEAQYSIYHERLKRGIYPCRYSAEARQFDFWIGEWDVKNTQGQPAGKSKIELMLGDCVIFENWTTAPPNIYSGKSFNLYNSVTKKWMQTWVDDKGAVIEFIDGEYKDNKLTFVTKPDAQNQVTKLTFHNLNPNLVRQHFEVTSDNGKTWTTTTDLYYNRVK
jgi:tetratricopeptide (TPR) repeat protein